jgi:hypothetical protein
MKRLLLFILPLLVILFIACNKNNEEENGTPTKLVKTVEIFESAPLTFTYFYDNKNRLSKIHFHYEAPEYFETEYNLTYGTNTVTYCINTGGNDETLATYTFDNNGYCVSYFCNKSTDCLVDFTYENGYLKSSNAPIYLGYQDGFESSYFWNNGNLTYAKTIYSSHPNNTLEYNAVFSNKEDLLNIPIQSVKLSGLGFDEMHPIKFKGIASKNYLVKQTAGGRNYTYEYTFDTDGYPTQIIERESAYYEESERKYIITYY